MAAFVKLITIRGEGIERAVRTALSHQHLGRRPRALPCVKNAA